MFYGVIVNVYYNINELWKFSDLMKFDLVNIEGDLGGVVIVYEVMFKKKEILNEYGEFSIIGVINVEGNILSVGGVKVKIYLVIKNLVLVMFVLNGVNYLEVIEMKSFMKSNIDIVLI